MALFWLHLLSRPHWSSIKLFYACNLHFHMKITIVCTFFHCSPTEQSDPRMNTVATVVICACVVAMSLAASLPAQYPIMPLKHYDPIDACLFICNICFGDMVRFVFFIVELLIHAHHENFIFDTEVNWNTFMI